MAPHGNRTASSQLTALTGVGAQPSFGGCVSELRQSTGKRVVG